MTNYGGLNIKFDRVAVNYLLNTVNGPTGREKRRKAKQVQFRAKQLAPRGMRSGIVVETEGIAEVVVSKHPATLYVIRGTRPHIIRAKNVRALKFRWHGRTVFFTWVMHPGTKPNDFLRRALRESRTL